VRIVDLSLLNFLDYSDINEYNLYENNDGKFVVNLNMKTKKILEAFIINNINDNIQYGKNNIIINTCQPMQNWRQIERDHAIKSCKYKTVDSSVYIDEIKLNQNIDNFFKRLPKITEKYISNTFSSLDDTSAINIRHKNISDLMRKMYLTKNVNYIQINSIDICDMYKILKIYLSNIGDLNFDDFNYNIIVDGNDTYIHNCYFPDEILEEVRLKLLEKGIL